ncbi:hypothetical protein FALBO_13833, partial [Fusarium albosuccineum]
MSVEDRTQVTVLGANEQVDHFHKSGYLDISSRVVVGGTDKQFNYAGVGHARRTNKESPIRLENLAHENRKTPFSAAANVFSWLFYGHVCPPAKNAPRDHSNAAGWYLGLISDTEWSPGSDRVCPLKNRTTTPRKTSRRQSFTLYPSIIQPQERAELRAAAVTISTQRHTE